VTNRCATCHDFHDRSMERATPVAATLLQDVNSTPPSAASPTSGVSREVSGSSFSPVPTRGDAVPTLRR
jgi:hypothetical protein